MFPKTILVILGGFIAGIIAAPSEVPPEKLQPTVIPIVAQSDELEPNGTYKFSYETGNGIIREETAYEKVLPRARDASSSEGGEDDDSDSNEIHVQRGSYSYTAPDGTVISVSYIADENGFQPIGDHLPRSPVSAPASITPEKSSRALKIADSSESASAPVGAKVVESPIESSKEKLAPDAPSIVTPKEVITSSNDKATPEAAPVPEVEDAKTESIPSSPTIENTAESVSTSASEQNEPMIAPATVGQETKAETAASTAISTTEQTLEGKSTVTEAELRATEAASTVSEASKTEATTVNIDVSTEATSTAASAQSTTESEQTSTPTASTRFAFKGTVASSEVFEQSSSTSAPESTSSGEAFGSSTSTEAVNQTTAEEAGKPSTVAPESASIEQSNSIATA